MFPQRKDLTASKPGNNEPISSFHLQSFLLHGKPQALKNKQKKTFPGPSSLLLFVLWLCCDCTWGASQAEMLFMLKQSNHLLIVLFCFLDPRDESKALAFITKHFLSVSKEKRSRSIWVLYFISPIQWDFFSGWLEVVSILIRPRRINKNWKIYKTPPSHPV